MSHNFYKITFHFTKALAITHGITFDAVLSYCVAKELINEADFVGKQCYAKQELQIIADNMPVAYEKKGAYSYALASWLMWDKGSEHNHSYTKKKRWADEYDSIVDFQGKRERVCISMGEFKACNILQPLKDIGKGWFYFATNDIEKVKYLLDKHLIGIGKDVKLGYGAFSHFEIEALYYNPFEGAILRPIPASPEDISKMKVGQCRVRRMGYTYPYWLPENTIDCLLPPRC